LATSSRASAQPQPGARVLFVFLDGVGLAPAGPGNPLSRVPMPRLQEHLGGPLVLDGAAGRAPDGACFHGIDACLGVEGTPQSATGQTALFTGLNAPALVGEHITAFPTRALREMIAERSLLRRAAEAGRRVLFANAHSERFWQMVRERGRSLGASTLTALAAGAPIPTLDDLAQGRAVLWDITHEVATGHLGYALPIVPPEEAGLRLARIAGEHDLVLYESFLTDLAGHGRIEPEWVLVRIDAFLGAVLDGLPDGCTLVLSSDHGNLEDSSTKMHTRNPVPLVAIGPQAARFRNIVDITGVAPAILEVLGVEAPAGRAAGEAGGSGRGQDA